MFQRQWPSAGDSYKVAPYFLLVTHTIHCWFCSFPQLTTVPAEVDYTQDTEGMPLEVTIGYESDFGTAASVAGLDTLWVDVTTALLGTGASPFYTSPPTLTGAPASNSFVVDLGRDTGASPTVGTYTVILTAQLKYNNGGTVVVMDIVEYTFNVNVAGGASFSEITSAQGTSGGFTNGAATDEKTSDGRVVSPEPTSLQIAQTSTNAALEDDLVITVDVTSPGDQAAYSLWVVATDDITMDTDASFIVQPYEWPDWAVSSSTSADSAGSEVSSLTITLTSIPIQYYNDQSVFVRFTIHFRDYSQGADPDARRALRALQEGSGGNGLASGSTELVAQVTFGSDDSGATIITSFMVISTTALSGAALFL
jgi:hypothetical protein